MPGRRTGPADLKVFWPDFPQDQFQVLQFRGPISVRSAAPGAKEIDLVDVILALPALCSHITVRRVLHVRALVHPINNRHLYPWTRIAKLLSSDPRTVKSWHQKGLKEVAGKVEEEKVCLIRQSLAPAIA